jgi:hypothetical protein
MNRVRILWWIHRRVVVPYQGRMVEHTLGRTLKPDVLGPLALLRSNGDHGAVMKVLLNVLLKRGNDVGILMLGIVVI